MENPGPRPTQNEWGATPSKVAGLPILVIICVARLHSLHVNLPFIYENSVLMFLLKKLAFLFEAQIVRFFPYLLY